MKIIIASVGGIIGIVITITCGFLVYRWNKKRKESINEPTLIIPDATIVKNNRNEHKFTRSCC